MNARTEAVDQEQPTPDSRESALAAFVKTHVDPGLSVGYRSTLNSLIREYGKAQFGRGYTQGAQDA